MKQPFAAYAEMVKRRYADLKAAKSRLDAATALHLRCAGYLQVGKELERHIPAPINLASPPLACATSGASLIMLLERGEILS